MHKRNLEVHHPSKFKHGLAYLNHYGRKRTFVDSDGEEYLVDGDSIYYFINKTGEVVFELKCLWVSVSKNYPVAIIAKYDKKYCLINLEAEGKEITPCLYEHIDYDFQEGMIKAKKNCKCGFLNPKGKEATPFVYEYIENFSEGLAAVQLGGKWGYINKKGETVIDFQFCEAEEFSEGLAAVEFNGNWCYIDKAGDCAYQILAYNNKLALNNSFGKFRF